MVYLICLRLSQTIAAVPKTILFEPKTRKKWFNVCHKCLFQPDPETKHSCQCQQHQLLLVESLRLLKAFAKGLYNLSCCICFAKGFWFWPQNEKITTHNTTHKPDFFACVVSILRAIFNSHNFCLRNWYGWTRWARNVRPAADVEISSHACCTLVGDRADFNRLAGRTPDLRNPAYLRVRGLWYCYFNVVSVSVPDSPFVTRCTGSNKAPIFPHGKLRRWVEGWASKYQEAREWVNGWLSDTGALSWVVWKF